MLTNLGSVNGCERGVHCRAFHRGVNSLVIEIAARDGDAHMIELKSVSKIFRTDVVETYALREFELNIGAGEFVAITGHSGSG